MNYQSETLVSQGFVYSCQHPVIDDLLESFPVTDESVLNYSKPGLAAETGSMIGPPSQTGSIIGAPSCPLVMVQTASYEIPPASSSLKTMRSAKLKSALDVKTYCTSDIDTFFVETPDVNNVTDLSKQMTAVEDAYCDVQSQPMQLTLNTSSRTTDCSKAAAKKSIHKDTIVESTDKSCNYTMLESWFQTDPITSLGRQDMYEEPQTQPLQLTQVTSELPSKDKGCTKGAQKKNSIPGEVAVKTTKCSICDKIVSSSKHLKEHLITHSGEKPFSCGECGFSVSKKSNLRAHKRVHSGEKPYMCGLCYKLFSQSSHLSSHMVTHTGKKNYECPDCHKMFSTRSNLKQHVNKQHTGDLKHTCDICGEKFGCQSWLQEHMKVHFQKRPYQCDVCKKRFKGKFYVAKHKKKFCGNEGYAKRWQVPGVVKPPGRRKKYKPSDQDGLSKRPRGRPKLSYRKRKKPRRKKLVISDTEEDADDPTAEIVPNSAGIIDENVPLALNITSAEIPNQNVESDCQKFHYDVDKSKIGESSFPDCSLDTFHTSANSSRPLTVESCDESSILELDLSAETILDFTKHDSQSLQHCFPEPQNLSSSSSSFRHTNEVSGTPGSINNSHFDSTLSDINVYTQPQNLCLPQNLSMHQQMSHSIDTVEPQNLSHPQKFLSHPLWDLSNIQPENLEEPQNLSIQHTLAQPQNLSLGQIQPQPQNLSHAGSVSHNIHQSHINPHVHALSHVHNLSSGVVDTSNSLPDPHIFLHSQDFTQPQNLTIDQSSLNRNYHTQNQPQNLVLPQNLSFSHIM